MIEATVVTGMVIQSSPVGDYDRRVVLLTKERGKITAFARGARRQYSAMMASTQVFAFGAFKVIEGRNAYTLVSADIENYFEKIPTDPMKACYASYFLEMAGYFTRENVNEVEMLKLLYQTLRILTREAVPYALIRRIYELRVFVINGEYPDTFHCVFCGSAENLNHFSALHAGVICDACRTGAGKLLPLDPSTLYTLQYIVTSPIEKLYTFNVSERVLHQLQMIMKGFMEHRIDWTFKSLEILEFMTNENTFQQ